MAFEHRSSTGPRRVRILAGRLSPGTGSHHYNRELARRLAQRGHSVSVVCLERAPDLPATVEQHELPPRGFANWRFVWRASSWLEWLRCSRALRHLALGEPDVVIAAEHLFMRAHARRFPHVPFVYLPHSLRVEDEIAGYGLPPSQHRPTLALYRRLQRWGLTHAAATMRFTRQSCGVLAADYPDLEAIPFEVNPPGVDVPVATPVVDARPDGPLRVLTVGRLTRPKRVDMLLDTLATFPHHAWTLDIVGDGPERRGLEERVRTADLASRVAFHGLQADPSRWYRRADLFVSTSRSESYGLVFVEAMSHGVPCLGLLPDAETHNVNEEIIDHGRTGLLADGVDGLRAVMASILDGPAQLQPLGIAAAAHVRAHLSWDAHLDRLEALWDRIGHGAAPAADTPEPARDSDTRA